MKNKPETDQSIEDLIRQKSLAEGFDLFGIAPAKLPQNIGDHLRDYIDLGHHGTMTWMEERVLQRSSPHHLWGDCKSVIMLGMNYGPDLDPMTKLDKTDMANISVYAGNKDYHDLIKKALKRIGRWVVEDYKCEIKVFVDTAPVMEKPLAQMAGLGWQGKHTNLVSRELGSWFFLGAIFTTLDLKENTPTTDYCGNCQSCLDICPTNAFPNPYQMDAKKCISYLTIEHKTHIPLEFRRPMGNRIYGCDDCLSVCPWNKFAQETEKTAFHTRDSLQAPMLRDLVMMDDNAFRALFIASPVKRIGRDRFIRNVLIAIGNSLDLNFIDILTEKLREPNPLIRAMAIWALGTILTEHQMMDRFEHLKHEHMPKEIDPDVMTEWNIF